IAVAEYAQVQMLAGRSAGFAGLAETRARADRVPTAHSGILHVRVVRGENFRVATAADAVANEDFALVRIVARWRECGDETRHSHQHTACRDRYVIVAAVDSDVGGRFVDAGVVQVALGVADI